MKIKSLLISALTISGLVYFPVILSGQTEIEEIEVTKQNVKMVTFLGVETSRVSKALRNHIDIPEGVGLTIDHVAEGSGAEKAGIQQYDILLVLDDQIIVNQEQLSTLIQSRDPGEKVSVEVLRKGKKIKSIVELGEREAKRQRGWGNNFSFPTPNPSKPIFPKNFDFHFDSEDFQKRMEEFQEKAAEMGNKALQYIPEIIIEREGKDGSKRITTFGRGANSTLITKDDLIAKMETIDGEKHYYISEKDAEEGQYIYAGVEPTEKEFEALPEKVKAVLKQLQQMKSFDWKNMDDVKNENIRVIINTGEEEAKLPPAIQESIKEKA